MFARIEKGKVVEFPIVDIRQAFPNTSFPETIEDKDLPKGYVRVHDAVSYPGVNWDEKLVETTPVISGSKWLRVWEAVKRDESEISHLKEVTERNVREQRDLLLSETDWTQGKDIPNQVSMKWAAYRKQLRDVTEQEGFPFSVQWPEKPEA